MKLFHCRKGRSLYRISNGNDGNELLFSRKEKRRFPVLRQFLRCLLLLPGKKNIVFLHKLLISCHEFLSVQNARHAFSENRLKIGHLRNSKLLFLGFTYNGFRQRMLTGLLYSCR